MELQFEMIVDEKELDEAIHEKAVEVLEYIFTKSQENLVKPDPRVSKHTITDTGFLLRSGSIDYERLRITYSSETADWVEFGTHPHYMSPYKLEGWVRRKLRLKGKDVTSACFAIAHKIAAEGQEARPYLRTALEDAKVKYG
jgi:hypothetical protein